jgi:hypothetical protein
MFEKLKLHRIIAPLAAAAVTALGVGGVAIAQSSGTTTPPNAAAVQGTQSEAAEPVGEKPDANEPAGEKPDAGEPKDAAGAKDATGTETGEQAGEVVDGDGPGGHADETPSATTAPGN